MPVDRFVRQPPGRRQPFAQADDPGERVDHPELVVGRLRYQQAAVVGAKVNGGIGLIGRGLLRQRDRCRSAILLSVPGRVTRRRRAGKMRCHRSYSMILHRPDSPGRLTWAKA